MIEVAYLILKRPTRSRGAFPFAISQCTRKYPAVYPWVSQLTKECSTAISDSNREPLNSHLLFCRVVYEMRLLSCLVKYILKCLSESTAFCVDYFYEEIIIIIVLIKYFCTTVKIMYFCREGV